MIILLYAIVKMDIIRLVMNQNVQNANINVLLVIYMKIIAHLVEDIEMRLHNQLVCVILDIWILLDLKIVFHVLHNVSDAYKHKQIVWHAKEQIDILLHHHAYVMMVILMEEKLIVHVFKIF